MGVTCALSSRLLSWCIQNDLSFPPVLDCSQKRWVSSRVVLSIEPSDWTVAWFTGLILSAVPDSVCLFRVPVGLRFCPQTLELSDLPADYPAFHSLWHLSVWCRTKQIKGLLQSSILGLRTHLTLLGCGLCEIISTTQAVNKTKPWIYNTLL